MTLEDEFRFEIPNNKTGKINYIKLVVEHITPHPQANIT